MNFRTLSRTVAAGLVLAAMGSSGASAGEWFPFPVEVWKPAFNADSPRTTIESLRDLFPAPWGVDCMDERVHP